MCTWGERGIHNYAQGSAWHCLHKRAQLGVGSCTLVATDSRRVRQRTDTRSCTCSRTCDSPVVLFRKYTTPVTLSRICVHPRKLCWGESRHAGLPSLHRPSKQGVRSVYAAQTQRPFPHLVHAHTIMHALCWRDSGEVGGTLGVSEPDVKRGFLVP
jgi:hypothetical protein